MRLWGRRLANAASQTYMESRFEGPGKPAGEIEHLVGKGLEIMCLSKKKGTWRRSARRVLAVGALTVTTFAGYSNLRGEILSEERAVESDWQLNPVVQAALAQVADLSSLSSGGDGGQGGTWVPLTGVERVSRSIYW
jgi:hypothetical protein